MKDNARRGILKGAALIAGAINSAPFKSPSFGTFLGEARKVHYCARKTEAPNEKHDVLNGEIAEKTGRSLWPASFYMSVGPGICPVYVSGGQPDALLATRAYRRAGACSRRNPTYSVY